LESGAWSQVLGVMCWPEQPPEACESIGFNYG
jgi:hypothetical protein